MSDEDKAELEQCPLCKGQVPVQNFWPEGDEHFKLFDCKRCGEFGADKQCILALRGSESYPDLMGVAREMSERGDQLRLTYTNMGAAKKLAPTTTTEKARRLLRAIERKSQFPSQTIELVREVDYPLVFGRGADELVFFLDYLEKRGWLEKNADSASISCELTASGWIEIESDRTASIESDKAFVAMWFAPEMNGAYEQGIRPAIEDDAGYKSIRIDDVEHIGKINDRIIAEIRESRFVVADFTGERGGAYYEAGYASGMGLPVIWTCRRDHFDQVHFDTRQFNHIIWEKPDDLRGKLAVRIRATIGKGPGKRQ